jgi:hypothetical protein
MKNNHLSDSEIQEYILDGSHELSITQHIDACERCKGKVKVYQHMILGIRNQAHAEFDFNLSETVISKITERNSPRSYVHTFWLVAMTGVVTIGITGYLFWKYLITLFPAISAMPMYFAITITITLFLFQGIDIVSKFKRKMDALNFPE